eukprot:TRINITY_DN69302_c0_g1_i1.p1 TRINITY_DN69302_c0_g1~~TRINITY_DN69302_c0_g1_i1.p1  ORF type:complete len:497 (+),score=8.68 TRINITY_DN69302_c0_g1_i1:139-1629(+)
MCSMERFVSSLRHLTFSQLQVLSSSDRTNTSLCDVWSSANGSVSSYGALVVRDVPGVSALRAEVFESMLRLAACPNRRVFLDALKTTSLASVLPSTGACSGPSAVAATDRGRSARPQSARHHHAPFLRTDVRSGFAPGETLSAVAFVDPMRTESTTPGIADNGALVPDYLLRGRPKGDTLGRRLPKTNPADIDIPFSFPPKQPTSYDTATEAAMTLARAVQRLSVLLSNVSAAALSLGPSRTAAAAAAATRNAKARCIVYRAHDPDSQKSTATQRAWLPPHCDLGVVTALLCPLQCPLSSSAGKVSGTQVCYERAGERFCDCNPPCGLTLLPAQNTACSDSVLRAETQPSGPPPCHDRARAEGGRDADQTRSDGASFVCVDHLLRPDDVLLQVGEAWNLVSLPDATDNNASGDVAQPHVAPSLHYVRECHETTRVQLAVFVSPPWDWPLVRPHPAVLAALDRAQVDAGLPTVSSRVPPNGTTFEAFSRASTAAYWR